METSNIKEDSNQLLALTLPLGTETGSRNVKEPCLSTGCNCFGQHCFTSTWRTKHADTFPRSSNASEVVRHQNWQQDCLLKQLFSFVKISDIVELHIRVINKQFSLDHVNQVCVWAYSIWVAILSIGTSLFSFIYLLRYLPRLLVISSSFGTCCFTTNSFATTTFVGISIVSIVSEWICFRHPARTSTWACTWTLDFASSFLAPIRHLLFLLYRHWSIPDIRVFGLLFILTGASNKDLMVCHWFVIRLWLLVIIILWVNAHLGLRMMLKGKHFKMINHPVKTTVLFVLFVLILRWCTLLLNELINQIIILNLWLLLWWIFFHLIIRVWSSYF